MLSPRWQNIYMGLADKIGQASKDDSNKVGSVLVRPNKTIASMGFNGFPSRIADNPLYLNDRTQRVKKYPRVVHAECNCLDWCADPDLTGYDMVVNMHPCGPCALRIINKGIATVYYKSVPDFEERWADKVAEARELFEEASLPVIRVEKVLSEDAEHLLRVFLKLAQIEGGPPKEDVERALMVLHRLL